MANRRPLRKHTCESCSRDFFSRSPLSRYCSVQCQVREWRARNKASQEQLEAEFNAQESEHNGEAA
ncbi:hypothetical protein D3C81_2153910 [compost metagenome]